MKQLLLIGFLLCGFLFTNAFAESAPIQITDGRIFITGNSDADYNNVSLTSGLFSALGSMGGTYSPWDDICKQTPKCALGRSFTVPAYPSISLGGCIGTCTQFTSGEFSINGKTYAQAYYRGNLDFSRLSFAIPKKMIRRGVVTFRKPFTVTGNLQVCSETNIDRNCPTGKILFDGGINGRGTLTVTMEIRTWDDGARRFQYLVQKGFDYRFEK